MGLRVGVLSNTIWPREWHVGFFERDGVYDLVDGDVYTSEIPWTKPSPGRSRAAMEAVGVDDPAACVYVGDRLYDDIWGAQQAGLRAIHVPLSTIPAEPGRPHRGRARRRRARAVAGARRRTPASAEGGAPFAGLRSAERCNRRKVGAASRVLHSSACGRHPTWRATRVMLTNPWSASSPAGGDLGTSPLGEGADLAISAVSAGSATVAADRSARRAREPRGTPRARPPGAAAAAPPR